MVAGEVDAWARYEGGKAGDKVGWTEKDVGGAVAVRVLELVHHLTGAIGIIAAISVAAFAAYESASEDQRITQATQGRKEMVGGIRSIFVNEGSYAGLDNDLAIKASSFHHKQMEKIRDL